VKNRSQTGSLVSISTRRRFAFDVVTSVPARRFSQTFQNRTGRAT
jgi:hypothetical protein